MLLPHFPVYQKDYVPLPANCLEVSEYGLLHPGLYKIRDPTQAHPNTFASIGVSCHDGWTVILARGQQGKQVVQRAIGREVQPSLFLWVQLPESAN